MTKDRDKIIYRKYETAPTYLSHSMYPVVDLHKLYMICKIQQIPKLKEDEFIYLKN